ncbi:MAG: carbonic anhydrase family protein [Gammaproteobacteria bacterium]
MKIARIYKFVLGLCLFGIAPIVFADDQQPVHTTVMTAETQSAKTPQQALQRLKSGNQRFVEGKMKNRNLLIQASSTATAQHPVVVVLNCIDSRTPPEIVFDQGIGDIFAIRIAGNIQNDDILGSMEFGTKVAGAKLIAVIGHTSCGAVRGACQQVKLGNLTGLLHKIQPAVKQAAKENGKADCADNAYVDQIAKDNVLLVMKQIQARSPVIRKLIDDGQIGIVGGMQDLETGQVTFFDDQSIMPK